MMLSGWVSVVLESCQVVIRYVGAVCGVECGRIEPERCDKIGCFLAWCILLVDDS